MGTISRAPIATGGFALPASPPCSRPPASGRHRRRPIRLSAPGTPPSGTRSRFATNRRDGPPGSPPTPLGAAVCEGRFRFGYNRKSREALLALTPQQPNLRRRLAAQLPGPEYHVAELTCGDGGTTYVLLGERDLLAIHHDRDIAASNGWSRVSTEGRPAPHGTPAEKRDPRQGADPPRRSRGDRRRGHRARRPGCRGDPAETERPGGRRYRARAGAPCRTEPRCGCARPDRCRSRNRRPTPISRASAAATPICGLSRSRAPPSKPCSTCRSSPEPARQLPSPLSPTSRSLMSANR